MMQQRLKKFAVALREKGLVPFLALFAIMLGLHLQFTLGTGDDPMNKELLQSYILVRRLAEMYHTWSARQLVDMVMYLFSALPYWVWRIVNPMILTAATYFAARLFAVERNPAFSWSLVGLTLCYQWVDMTSAGWVCTTLGFLWPLTAGLCAMQPYVNLRSGKPVPKWQYALSLLLFVYAVNMEQFMVVVSLVLLVLTLGLWITKRKIHWYLKAQLGVCVAGMLYFATCPGVKARMLNEMATSFIDFQMRTTFQKIELALANGFSHLMYQTNYLFFVLCLLIFLCIWRQYSNKVYRLMAAVPLAFVTVLGLFSAQSCALVPKLTFFQHALTSTGMITVATAGTPKRYVAFFLLCVLFSLCIVNLYLAFGHSVDAIAGVTLLCAGFASHAMMGFSTSIWSSGDRTAFFCSMSLIAICMLLCKKRLPYKTKSWMVAQVAIWCCALAQCVSLIGA